jgi:hypothetical protein
MDEIFISRSDLRELLLRAYRAGNENFAELSGEFADEIMRECKGSNATSSGEITLSPAAGTFTLGINSTPHYYSYYAAQDRAPPPSLGETTLWS